MIVHKDSGYIEVIIGSMFSGKTSTLVNIYEKALYCNIKPLVINHSFDTRYSESQMSTHDKKMIPCTFTKKLYDINNNDEKNEVLMNSKVILINEGQFFNDLYYWVKDMCDNHNKQIYVCGLDGDYKRNKIGDILDLIPMADSIVKLNSICKHCSSKKKAIFTHRISNECEQVVIGSDNYIPVCRNCYELLNK